MTSNDLTNPFGAGRFDDRVAIVTGSSQGLGEAVARLMAARGAAGIVVTGRDHDKAEDVAASLPCDAIGFGAELADPATPDRLVDAARERFGRLDSLVNAGATTVRGSVWDTTAELWDEMLAVNTRAPGLLTTAAAKLMVQSGAEGTIVNVGSVAAYAGADFLYPYSVSKMALQALTRNAAWSLMRHRIRVNLVQPGWMATPGEDVIQKRFHGGDDEWLSTAALTQPFGRLIHPDELARAICYLASSESGMMTGSIIDFDQSILGGGDAAKPPPGPVWGEPDHGGPASAASDGAQS
ncbi:MAG: SDR family oxidoreductase [Actinomycetota bacterium]